MTKERKAPRDWKTWEDFANCYDLVLFNECVNIQDGNVLDEWYENHTCDDDECTDEVFQWYAIACGDSDAKFLNNNFNMDIFYSEVLGLHILPVYHFGTAWDYVNLSMNKTIDND